jgi:sigma-B regulation protein RsbU (phosphoserine phosphatase)
MPLHPPSASQTQCNSRATVPRPPEGEPRQKRPEPEFIAWIGRFWERVTEGLELSQLWKQFKSDAESSFRFYQRDFDARSPHEGRRKDILHTIQEFAWAILEKLTPARRVLLLLAIFLLLFGGMSFHYTDNAGQSHAVDFGIRSYGVLILFVLLMLEIADRVVMKRDLEIARDIQGWLLPSTPPNVPGLAIAFATRPANTVAGDFYDVFPRTAASNESHYLLAVADVAGKSIPAALLMATFQASLKTLSSIACPLAQLVANLNQYACSNSQGGLRFTTALIAEFDANTRVLNYINAGHNEPILQRATGEIERLSHGGLPLGILAETNYETGSLVLQPGDWLVVFTDGLVEAENSARDEFGEARLFEVLKSSAGSSPQELLSQIMTRLDAFVGTAPQHDDVTCLVVKCS